MNTKSSKKRGGEKKNKKKERIDLILISTLIGQTVCGGVCGDWVEREREGER